MSFVAGREAIHEVKKALGIPDGVSVSKIVLEFSHDGGPVAYVKGFVGKFSLDGICQAVKDVSVADDCTVTYET